MSASPMEVRDAGTPAWSAPPVLFLLIALAIAGSFWIVPILSAPDKSPDGLVLFREGGDPDYLPQVAAAAWLKFGEISVKEYAGTGVRSFPFVPIIIHALFYRVAGSVGFILADILMVVLYACLLRQFLLIAGVARRPAELLCLAVISSTAHWFVEKASAIVHHPVPAMFWEFRFPRPSVTQTVFVLLLILATMLIARPQRSAWFFALFGVSFAAVLQSDIYSALDAAFVIGAVSVVVIVASHDRWAAVKRLCAAAAAMGLASVPFIYQQLHTSSDLKRRWGVFSTRYYRALLPGVDVMACAVMVIVVAVVLAILYWRGDLKRRRIAALTVVATAVGASVISGPAWLAVLHQTIQIFHFRDQTELTIGYAFLLYAGLLLTDFNEVFTVRRLPEERWSMLTAVASAVFVGLCLLNAYRSSVTRNGAELPTAMSMVLNNLDLPHYRTDFRELHSVLDRPEYADAAVLGTFDVQLSNWWQYRRRYVYLVDGFNSTLPDSEMESRVCQFLRLVGTSTEEFGHLLDRLYFLMRFMGYMAPRGLIRTPLPESEKSRLMMVYDRAGAGEAEQRANALDIIVFDKDQLRAYVHPERADRFRLAWSNRTFELWVPNSRTRMHLPTPGAENAALGVAAANRERSPGSPVAGRPSEPVPLSARAQSRRCPVNSPAGSCAESI